MTLFNLFLLDLEAQGNLLLLRFHAHAHIIAVSVSARGSPWSLCCPRFTLQLYGTHALIVSKALEGVGGR